MQPGLGFWGTSKPTATYTLFGTGTPTGFGVDTSTSSLVLGTKVRIASDGHVTALRFYRPNTTQNVPTLRLWNSNGTQLVSVNTATATGSAGWVEVALGSPYAVSAGLYIVSYYASNGNFATTSGHFNTARTSGPLTAVQSGGADGGNGVFNYTSSHAFPSDTVSATCYWADLKFVG